MTARASSPQPENGPFHLILVGPPGAGKGTLARALARRNLEHVSSGAVFREEVRRGTPFGVTFGKALSKGEFVPDEETLAVMRKWFFSRKGRKGFMLDGFPRNLLQAQVFDEWMETVRKTLTACVYLEISLEVAIRRISGRRTCPADGSVYHLTFQPPMKAGICDRCGAGLVQRPDDTRETVIRRWKVFEERTVPVLDHYRERALLCRVDGDRPLADVRDDVEAILQ